MSAGFSLFVTLGTIISLVGLVLLLHFNRKIRTPGQTTGHSHDGIEEYDNPLPAWWYWWFILTIVYGVGYLLYYPGLGNFPGFGDWTKVGELEVEQQLADEKYGPIYAQYRNLTLDELAQTPEAVRMGRRIFASNCTVCHGARGEGSFGFPNLTDSEWQWGGADADITRTILGGRQAVMLPWVDILGDAGVTEVTEYVLLMAGRDDVDEALAARGKTHFDVYCIACHGPDGKGQKALGAPDLTNDIWLYGGDRLRIEHVIRKGRNGAMPAFALRLGEDRAHIVAGYVRSLSATSDAARQR